MSSVSFEQLLTIYRHTTFDTQGDEGLLSIASQEVLAALRAIEGDDRAGEDANLAVLVEPNTLAIGQEVRVRVAAPRLAIGLLVRSFDNLLDAPEARISEPKAYFVIDDRLEKATIPLPAMLIAYRKVLDVVALFAEAASYLDRMRQELVFFREGKFAVSVRYNSKNVSRFSVEAADKLLEIFRDDVHKDQKLAILSEAIVHTCESQPAARRFAYLLENMGILTDEVRNGYRLFASSFSYAKIRSELENAKVEYVGKIHKTLIDIQGQLLGIPVATIIVASQMRVATSCGLEFWTNMAVLSGAWVFLILIAIAIGNQWLTLSSIAEDIGRQKCKLASDFAAISNQFVDVFDGLSRRILWHRSALIGICVIALAGAIFATFAFRRFNGVDPMVCLATRAPLSALTVPAAGSTRAKGPAPAESASGVVSVQPGSSSGGAGVTQPNVRAQTLPADGGASPTVAAGAARQ